MITPFIFLFLIEIFPLKSTGSFFTTGNATYIFLLVSILVGITRREILIENKKLVGFGYINLSHQITHLEVLKNIIYPMKDSREARHIIKSYLRKHKNLKIIPLQNQ